MPVILSIHAGSGRTIFDPEYLIDSWETEDGLPENSATAMVQTPDGYLWFGTFNGLVRFDGVQFTVFNPSNTPQLPSSRIVNLYLDGSQRLWVSTFRGLVHSQSNQWTAFQTQSQWTGDYVRTFSEVDGVLCLTSFDGKIFREQGGKFEELPPPPGSLKHGFLGHVDRQGQIWVEQHQSSYFGYWDGRQWISSHLTNELFPNFISMKGLPDGRLIVLEEKELLMIEGETVISRLPLTSSKLPARDVWSMNQDRQGMVWISSQSGLSRIAPDGGVRHFTSAKELTYSSIRFTFEDREKNLWVGTSGGGLMRFRPRKFATFGDESGLTERNIKAVLEEDPGVILLGTYGAGLFRWDNGKVSRVETNQQPILQWTQCLLRDRQQNLWIGGYGDTFPITMISSQDRRAVPISDCGGNSVRTIWEDSRGRIWIGGGKSVSLYSNGTYLLQTSTDADSLSDIRYFAETQDRLWAGGANGLSCYENGQWRVVQDATGRSFEEIFCLKTESNGSLWVGVAGTGLKRYKNNQWSSVSATNSLPTKSIYCILEDEMGYWWMGSSRGIIRVAGTDLNRVADGTLSQLNCQLFDQSDGLASIECTAGTQSNALKDSRGRLWFATIKGAAMIDPKFLQLNTNPPPLRLENVSYTDRQGKRVKLTVGKEIPISDHSSDKTPWWAMVPAGSSQFEARFAVLSFTSPQKVLLNYRLWRNEVLFLSDESHDRAIFARWLPPGDYKMEVTAANEDGFRSDQGVSLSFIVKPFLWQTLWFRSAMILLFGGAIGIGVERRHRNRLRLTEERLRQQQALAEERSRSAAITQYSSDIITLFGAEGRIIYESPSTSRILGYPEGFFLNKDPLELVHADDAIQVKQAFQEMIKGTASHIPITFRFKHARGDWIELESLGTDLLNHPGVLGLMVTSRDITERRKAEEALRNAHEQLVNIIESLPDPTFVIDRNKKVIAWNHAIEILSGVTKAEMLGQGDFAYAIPFFGQRQPLLIDFIEALPEETNPAYKYLRTVGDKVYAESYLPSVYQGKGAHLWGVAAPLYDRHGARWGAIEVIRDITDQVQASWRLRESEAKFRNIFENAGDAILMMDQDRIIECNNRTLEVFGCTRQQIIEATPYQLSPSFQPDGQNSREKALELIQNALSHGTINFEWSHLRHDGSPFDVEITLSRIEVERRILLQAIVRNITERKRAEQELLHLQNLLRNMINSMPSILVAVDGNGRVTHWNQSAEKFTGRLAGQACGEALENVLPSMQGRVQCVHTAIQMRQIQSLTKQAIKVGDEIQYHDLVVYPLVSNGVQGAVIRLDNITERVRVEQLMVQTEKMISIGGLAAGMAHEINNPLGIITQAAQNIQRRVSPELPANQKVADSLGLNLGHLRLYFEKRQIIQFIKDIREASSRAAQIVANMLQFSRKNQSGHTSYDLSEVLEKSLELAANDYDLKKRYDFRNISVIREYDSAVPAVPLGLVEMEQVFLNLIKNAAQAMAANPPERKSILTLRLKREEKYAVVEVEDNGPGMEAKVMQRVFEPFFTTKEPGVGTGLGLSVSYMIVTQNHKGLITVDSAPGQGARFTIRLPISGAELR